MVEKIRWYFMSWSGHHFTNR